MSQQAELALIARKIENEVVQQRAIDGYINATAMCKAAGKRFHDYRKMVSTREFLDVLGPKTRIPVFGPDGLIRSKRGGNRPDLRGVWVHPQVAINLAQWVSPAFAVRVTEWVFEWLSGRTPSHTPDHIRRYVLNQPKIPATHFSMLNQMMLRLVAPLERKDYILPDRLMPDISLGRMFSRWLREHGYDPDSFPNYDHEFLDHRPVVKARLYPNEVMTEFNLQLDEWLRDGRARKYLGVRDEKAIVPLDRVIAALPAPPKQLGPGDSDQ